jgi:hypothetical protein
MQLTPVASSMTANLSSKKKRQGLQHLQSSMERFEDKAFMHSVSTCSTADLSQMPSDDDGQNIHGEEDHTMMITNIPCRFGQRDIEEAINSVGFGGTYDFVYAPRRNATHEGNIGYAFVNFKDAYTSQSFIAAFDGYQFPGSKSLKRCVVKTAHQQGFNPMTVPRKASGNRHQREMMQAGITVGGH